MTNEQMAFIIIGLLWREAAGVLVKLFNYIFNIIHLRKHRRNTIKTLDRMVAAGTIEGYEMIGVSGMFGDCPTFDVRCGPEWKAKKLTLVDD